MENVSAFSSLFRKEIGFVLELKGKYCFTGSRYIGGYDPVASDYDMVVYLPSKEAVKLFDKLSERSWYLGGSASENFTSFRKDDLNIILVTDKNQFGKWAMATEVAKAFQLWDKDIRVELFEQLRTQENEASKRKSEGTKATAVGSGPAYSWGTFP